MVSSEADAVQRADVLRRLYTATCLCSAFLVVEVIGGYLSGSLAVLSDAAHLFADLASFAIAIIAAHFAALPTTDQHTFGLKRSESLAALFSMLSLAFVSLGLAFEAVRRLYMTEAEVDGKIMSGVAAIGVFVNVALALVLGVEHHVHLPGADHGHSHDHGCDGHDLEMDHGHQDDHNHSSSAHDHHNGEHGHGQDCTGHDHHDSHRHDGHDHGHGHDHHKENNTQTTGRDPDCDHNNSGDHDGHSHVHAVAETTKLLSNSQHCNGHYNALHADEVIPEKVPRNINLQAAYLHVMGDLAQSAAVLIAGLVIWCRPEWRIIDPICTLFFCAIVFYSTLGVLRSSISVLLEEVPPNIKWGDMYKAIQGVEGVENVHDLHIWSISHGNPTLSVHCSTMGDPQKVLEEVYSAVKKQGIRHATIQVQANGQECVTCHGHPGCDELRVSAKNILA
jgi:solute carrier family 30 (zinc transporter), member 2